MNGRTAALPGLTGSVLVKTFLLVGTEVGQDVFGRHSLCKLIETVTLGIIYIDGSRPEYLQVSCKVLVFFHVNAHQYEAGLEQA